MCIKRFGEINKDDVAVVGSKGASLGEMTCACISVPSVFAVLSDAVVERMMEWS